MPGTEAADVLFGALDVTVGERPIAGVDAVLTLGTAYLDLLASGASPTSTVPATDAGPTSPRRRARRPPVTDLAPDADARAVATLAARAADEKQGRDIVVLDVGAILAIAEMFVVLDAPNRRLVRTLVDEIEEAVRAATGRSPRRVEGVKEQQWVLIDYGDVVVHVFLDEIRRFYEIERLYRDVPVVAWRAGDGAPSRLTRADETPGHQRRHRAGPWCATASRAVSFLAASGL